MRIGGRVLEHSARQARAEGRVAEQVALHIPWFYVLRKTVKGGSWQTWRGDRRKGVREDGCGGA
ncbi:hypothetical protein GCM10007147_17440 [Nocardiopsis kunsanensis]|uniref:Uncharacterized protein n=1 Tax=Nocardiopsis kunsanensis TaxID=141693 RepID=A0A918XAQ2_9ACTN|nr:hypothetical protein GCM10007147_17440 [Nocardiopsis kunsanensis]